MSDLYFGDPSKRPLTREDKKLLWYGVIILLAIIGWFAFFNPNTQSYDGEGSISVFPENADAKNYRLDNTSITVTDNGRGWFKHRYSYSIGTATWPDGGELDFNGFCHINYPATSAVCDSNSGKYTVEVTTPPDPPDASSYDPNN